MRSYIKHISENEQTTYITNYLKESIAKKIDFLVHILFEQDKKAWNIALNITSNESASHFDELTNLLNLIHNISSNEEIPYTLIENFAQNLLLTPELNIYINKLIISNFQ